LFQCLHPRTPTWIPSHLPTSIPKTLVEKCSYYLPSTLPSIPTNPYATPYHTYVPTSVWLPTYIPSTVSPTLVEKCSAFIPPAPVENLAPVVAEPYYTFENKKVLENNVEPIVSPPM